MNGYHRQSANPDYGRRVWMLALGPGVPAGKQIDRAVPITAVAATALTYLGLPATEDAAEAARKIS
ncbi:MAG: hypothetical protein IT426_19545 [Pirellulales bacterium]|nr:hypothetical protein [Pirellulales bacterium]